MSARNIYHDSVVKALEADGWTITDDPLPIGYGGRDLYIDLGAKRETIGAVKGEEKIAVEVQSFLNQSPVRDIEEAVGQYMIYRMLLAEARQDRDLFVAVPDRVFNTILSEPFGRLVLARLRLQILVFDAANSKVIQWISEDDTEKLFNA